MRVPQHVVDFSALFSFETPPWSAWPARLTWPAKRRVAQYTGPLNDAEMIKNRLGQRSETYATGIGSHPTIAGSAH